MEKYKERKSIYAPDEGVWDRVVECSKEGGISVSQLLLSPFQRVGTIQVGLGQVNRIEGKLDLLIPKGMPGSLSAGRRYESESLDLDHPVKEISKGDEIELRKAQAVGQAKLDAERKDRGTIKSEKISKVRDGLESLTGFSGEFSKNKQVGKKGK